MHRTKPLHDLKGHREKFEDGNYICAGTYGHDHGIAALMAESMAKRYSLKVRVLEKIVRVQGEHGLVRKPLYSIWYKVIER
jgi:hypothetical protein